MTYTNADNPQLTRNSPKGIEFGSVVKIAGKPEKCTINATAIPKNINSLFFIHLGENAFIDMFIDCRF